MDLSRALQKKLKELVTFYYFADPSTYKDLAAAASAIVFSCMPASTTIKLTSDGDVERFDTNKDLHWDQASMDQVSAVARAPQTVNALVRRMESIAATLRGIPELASTAKRYEPDQINLDNLVRSALTRIFSSSPTPELLGSLLFLEAQLVRHAVDTGVEMARFRSSASDKPAEALEHLAKFGEDLSSTFNEVLGSHPFLTGASRPLGTLLFLEASSVFDPSLGSDGLTALMNITVVQSGQLSVDEMLGGKITDKIILHEQPFVQA